MVKNMVFAVAALAITAGSLFALTHRSPEMAGVTAKCPPSCCEGCEECGDGCCE